MNFQQYFNIEYKNQLQLNLVNRVQQDIANKDKQQADKIARYAYKWDLNIKDIYADLLAKDQYAMRQIAIDPAKQNISEQLQAKFNGKITLLNKKNPHIWTHGGATTKTIDGKLNDYFVFMKVIRQNGGTQENVKKEAEEFIRVVQRDPTAKDKKFIVLIDDFTVPCLNRYKAFVNSNDVKVMNSDELKLRKDI